MQILKGNSIKDQLLSADGILAGMARKMLLLEKVSQRKGKNPIDIYANGYASSCSSGKILCTYFALINSTIKRIVIAIDDCAKDAELFANITIKVVDGGEKTYRHKIKPGVNFLKDELSLDQGDRVSVSISFGTDRPKGIWIAIRGERV